ncbi:MAG: hypothetical protein K0Q92_2414 [Steroidobacteraceae bacterium]|nr:hypothetical protein [Steroidobacteraceae bacterium]
MKPLLAALLLLGATGPQARTPAPSSDESHAATFEPDAPPAAPPAVDQREATLRDLEFRTGKAQSGRRQLAEALSEMRADGMEQRVFMIGCQVANTTVKIPEFFQYARQQVKKLEKPANHQALTAEQRERLASLKATLSTLEAAPEFDCARIWAESPTPA